MGQASEDLELQEVSEDFKGGRCKLHDCEFRYDLYRHGCYWCEKNSKMRKDNAV